MHAFATTLLQAYEIGRWAFIYELEQHHKPQKDVGTSRPHKILCIVDANDWLVAYVGLGI